MATTKIWDVRGRLDGVIRYAENPDKTVNPQFAERDIQGLRDVMDYTCNDFKTEKQFFVTGLNCDPVNARRQMIRTKQRYGKTDGIIAFHGYQSFAPGEVTAQQAHDVGVELARRLWGERFEVVVVTHLNTRCYHNHFVLNSVSFADGKRYYDNKATYRLMRQISDELCRAQHLSVIENPAMRGKSYAEWQAENEERPTYNSVARADVDWCITASLTFVLFVQRTI